MSAAGQEPPVSPCVRHCVLDPAGVCQGCGRTLDEISGWLAATDAERHRICQRARQRRERRPSSPMPSEPGP